MYAELAADTYFESAAELDAFLEDVGIVLEKPPRETLFAAGEAFQDYLARRGETLQCPACGHRTAFECPDCGERITARQHVAADFLIGAHANTADALLTFDSGFFAEYFDLEIRSIRG